MPGEFIKAIELHREYHGYQAVLADFIQEGHFARHIRRMKLLYGERRRALVEGLAMHWGKELKVVGAEAGMHLVALLPRGKSDAVIAKKAAQQGISAMPLSSCYLGKPALQGLILGYGGVDAWQMSDALPKLAGIL